jgi:peptidoglycan/xylan/chitin deacetylase (PgdA/CDA1 family)
MLSIVPRRGDFAMRARAGTVAILTYHRLVSAVASRISDVRFEDFAEQMKELAKRTRAVKDGIVTLENGLHACITFDDGTADHAPAAKLLTELGLAGTFFIISGRLGEEGYLSAADVAGLPACGHRVAAHTVSHRSLLSLSEAEMRDELNVSRATLQRLTGEPINWMAFPGGYYSSGCIAAAHMAGFEVMRTMDRGFAAIPLRKAVPCWPIMSWHDLEMFKRVLECRAPLWPHRIARGIRSTLGEPLYLYLRDKAIALTGPRAVRRN